MICMFPVLPVPLPPTPPTTTCSFSLDTFEGVSMSSFFSISPSHSSLFPGDKAQAVSITFRADREIAIKEQPLLKCQVMDMHVSKEGEVIACIPIKLSARSVFARCLVLAHVHTHTV